MHVPDGFLDPATSTTTAVIAAGALAVALKQSRNQLDERAAPLAGLVAAYVFAVQMLNFPVGVGTSGHLLGGTLAAVLVGPWTAVLCMSVVLVVQALLFADGGLTALGTNVLLMGVVTVFVGWAVVRAVLAVLPRRPMSVVPAAFAGALVSVAAAAMAFTGLYAVGGTTQLPLGALLASMLGWHLLIGVGEAVITALTVSAVVGVRPDLVYAARDLRPRLVLKDAHGRTVPAPAAAPAVSAAGGRTVVVAAGLAILLLAGVASFFASGSPDGLERVAEDRGFLASARDHAVGSLPLADYGDVAGIPVGAAGALGALVTVAVALVVTRAAVRRRGGVDRVDERV